MIVGGDLPRFDRIADFLSQRCCRARKASGTLRPPMNHGQGRHSIKRRRKKLPIAATFREVQALAVVPDRLCVVTAEAGDISEAPKGIAKSPSESIDPGTIERILQITDSS